MPQERPEYQPDPNGPLDDQAGADAASEADGQPEDATSEALRAAREALTSIQAEADAAMGDGRQAAPADADRDGQTETMADAVVQAALKAAARAGAGGGGVSGDAKPLDLPDFDLSSVAGVQHGLDMLADVQLDVRIELGRTRMLVEDVLRLSSGAVVELDKLAGDPLDVYVNDRLVARGEVLVLNDNFCIRVNEIIDSVGEQAVGPAES